jgi:hypothetical protein
MVTSRNREWKRIMLSMRWIKKLVYKASIFSSESGVGREKASNSRDVALRQEI